LLKKWTTLSRKVVTENKYWSYILDKFEIAGVSRGEYHFVHTGGSTMIIPITSSNKILLVNQYRYLNDRESLEFPCGSIQNNISPKENAIKELREETGYSCKQINIIGEFSPYSGVSDEMCSVFLAIQLFESPLPSDTTEDFELSEYSIAEIDDLIKDGTIWDGMSIAAWHLSREQAINLTK